MSSVGRVLVSVGDESSPGLVAYVKGGEHVRDLMVRVGERCSVKKGSFYLMLGKHYLHPDDPADVLRYDETVRLVMGTFDPMAQYKLGRPEDGDNNMATASQDHVEKEATQPVEVVPGVVPTIGQSVKVETTGGDDEDNGERSRELQQGKRRLSDTTPGSHPRGGPRRRMPRAQERAAKWRKMCNTLQKTSNPRARDRAAKWREFQAWQAGKYQGRQVVPLNHAGFNQYEAAGVDTRETDQVDYNEARPVIPYQPLAAGDQEESDLDEQSTYAVFSPEPPESPTTHSAPRSLAKAPPPLGRRDPRLRHI